MYVDCREMNDMHMPGEHHQRRLNEAHIDLPAEEGKQIIHLGLVMLSYPSESVVETRRCRTAHEAKPAKASTYSDPEEYEKWHMYELRMDVTDDSCKM